MDRREGTKHRIPEQENHEVELSNTTFKVQYQNDPLGPFGFNKPRREVNPGRQSEEEHPLSGVDAEEMWVDEEPPRRRKARFKSTKGNKRGASPRARSKSPRRKVHTIDQLEEVLATCVPKIERVEGDLHLHLSLYPVTHIHGSYPAGAAPTAMVPNVNNITVINSNTRSCTAEHGSEADEGS
jgi:hypothetical protein